jgi:hypothetical protein
MLASSAPVTRCFGRSTNRPVIPGERSFQLPALMHDPRALSQGDARRWPARHGCPVGRLCHLEVVHAGDVLDDETRECLAALAVADEAEAGGRGDVACDAAHAAAPAPKREVDDIAA